MPTVLDPADLLISEAQLLPLAEVLNLPPDRLLGVSPDALQTLNQLGVATVFDLAMSSVFNAAAQLEDAATNPASAMNRFGRPITDLLKPGVTGVVAVPDLRNQGIEILAGIGDAEVTKTALGVRTVRDLSVYPPFRAAKEILSRAFFPEQVAEFDPESPADLIPKSGEFPTERVQFTVLVLDQILRPDGAPPLIDLAGPDFQPIDISPVADPNFGFSTLGLGMLLTLNQSWFMQGVTLGHLLHSMALAAGESTRIAVVDWSRKTSAGQTEQIAESEDLSQDTSRNRSISEVTEAVAREAQEGFSRTKSESTTKQAGGSAGGVIGGVIGFGASASIGKTKTSAESYATSAGSREVGASMLQQASDRTHQHAHSARTRRASVVREVSQTEHESVSTRVITNYNHMHALTVQYYEVLQAWRTETSVTRCDRVVFVPFKLIDFSNVNLLRRFRGALIDAALTPAIRDALVNFDTLEFVPERSVAFPRVGGTLGDVLRRPRIVTEVLLRRRPGEPGSEEPPPDEEEPPPRPPRPPRPPSPAGDIADDLWENAASKLSAFFGTPTLRRGSQSFFVPSDVRVEEGAVQSTVRTLQLVFVLRDGTRIIDLTRSVALAEVSRIAIAGSSADADVAATAVLALSRNGIVFPLELPTVTVLKGAQETKLVEIRAAGADVNLVQHLADNRLHYSQAVYRELDAAMIAGLLAPFQVTMNGTAFPLVQVAEPAPVRIVGNALAFKINTDPLNDAEWRAFMEARGIVIGQSKVDIVPLSSGGIFAEAVLGRFNCAEKLDLSRFFNWQDSPIPILPTEIAAIQTGTRATAEDLKPGQFSAPLVSITPPAALPDPSGLAGTLTAIQNANLFRDITGLSGTIQLAQETAKLSGAAATSAATQATEALKAGVDLEKAKLAKGLQDKSATEKGAVVNKEEELKKKQAAEAAAKQAEAAKKPSGGSGGGGASAGGGGATPPAPAPTTTGNTALDRIIGNTDGLRSFLGLAADSPVPTPAVTNEGAPLQEWDFVGGGYELLFREFTTDPPKPATDSPEFFKAILEADAWVPTLAEDFRPLLLGDRRVLAPDFGELLFAVSLLPARSLRALNVVGYASDSTTMNFVREFIFTASEEGLSSRSIAADGLSALTLQKLLALDGDAPIATSSGGVKLADVRKSFAPDGEVRLFNLENRLSPEFVQAAANLFQVRATGLVKLPAVVTAEVIAEGEVNETILAKKVVGGGKSFSSFVNLLAEDRAVTGVATAFPRRA